jgi:uncharacterized protein
MVMVDTPTETDVTAPEGLLAEIRQLRGRLTEITGVVVATIDGLLVAHDVEGGQAATHPETLAAMSAAQLGLGQQIASLCSSGDFRESVTAASGGFVATFAAGPAALLTIIGGPGLNIGLLHHEARPVAARLGALIPPTF